VALGDNEIMRFGSLAIVVVYPPNFTFSGYLLSAAWAGAEKIAAKTKIESKSAFDRKWVRNMKNSLKDMREENWAK
jgi:hypothetical protein